MKCFIPTHCTRLWKTTKLIVANKHFFFLFEFNLPYLVLAFYFNMYVSISDMKLWLSERGYSKEIIDSEMAWELKSVTGVPFVITYHPKLRQIASIMKKYQNILHQDQSVERVLTPFLMVSYCNAINLCSYLVRGKLYPLERTRGSYKCGSTRCQVCNNIE